MYGTGDAVLHVYNLIVVWNVNSAMKIVAIEFKTILHGLQGMECHHLIVVCV